LKVLTGQGAATDTTTAAGKPDTSVELCTGLGISRRTLYRHVTPDDESRPGGVPVLWSALAEPHADLSQSNV
jgi:hypothetical protein